MRRGELWTLQDDGYASKPRPVVIVQSDRLAQLESVTLCLITSCEAPAMPTRVRIEPSEANGLRSTSYVMTDKIASVRRSMLGKHIGSLADTDMAKVTDALAIVLGIEPR